MLIFYTYQVYILDKDRLVIDGFSYDGKGFGVYIHVATQVSTIIFGENTGLPPPPPHTVKKKKRKKRKKKKKEREKKKRKRDGKKEKEKEREKEKREKHIKS